MALSPTAYSRLFPANGRFCTGRLYLFAVLGQRRVAGCAAAAGRARVRFGSVQPWVQRFAVSWRRNVRFFEHRYRVLEELEETGALWGFLVEENEVAMRLGDPYHFVAFTPWGLTGAVLQPDGHLERVSDATALIIERLQAEFLVQPKFDFIWLTDLDGDYDDVRSGAARAFLPTAPGTTTDLAAWVDGLLDDGSRYGLECGIVEAIEAPPRLARETGRFFLARDPRIGAALWPTETLPSVGFFTDMHVDGEGELDTADELFNQMGETLAYAGDVVSAVMERFEVRGST